MIKTLLLSCALMTSTMAQELTVPKACNIKTYAQIILTQKKNSKEVQKEIVRESDCDAATLSAFTNTVIGAQGDLREEHLVALLGEQNIQQEIFLEPSKISIDNIENVIKKQAPINDSFELSNIQFVGIEGAIVLNEQDKLKIDCTNCQLLGDQNIKMSVYNPILADSKLFWARTQVMKKIRVWKVKSDINTMNETNLNSQMVSEEIAVSKPENYLSDAQDLKYFKLNKSLRRGDIVRQTDVSPIQLVKVGSRVKIKIENKNLNLSSTGVASKSGSFGDSIELTNLNSKKKVVGRVIDYNTVVIDL